MLNTLCHLRSIVASPTLVGLGVLVLLCLAAVLVRRLRWLAVWQLPRCVLVGFLALALVTTLLSGKPGTNGTDRAGAPMRSGAHTSWMDEDAGCGSNGDADRGDVARTRLGSLQWVPNSRFVWKIPIGWHRKSPGVKTVMVSMFQIAKGAMIKILGRCW